MASSVSRSPASMSRTSGSPSRTPASERTGSTRPARGTQTQPSGVRSGTGNTSSRTHTRLAPEHSGRSSFTSASRPQPSASTGTPRASTGSLRPGARGDQVRSLQDKLRTAGHNPGRTDGVFGQRTEGAVRDFQRAQGLRVDGVAGRRTLAALNGVDRMEPSRPGATGTNRVDPSSPTPNGGVNGTARLNNYPNGPGLATGTITVNGNTYQFNSGSGSRYSVPRGTYNVRRHLDRRTTPGFERDGVGYSYILEDDRRRGSDSMRDPRTGRTRTLLRIHPDGGPRGTQGCIGIVGDAETLLRFQRDLRAELSRNGGRYTLRVE